MRSEILRQIKDMEYRDKKRTDRRPERSGASRDRTPHGGRGRERETELPEGVIVGRNAVLELLKSGRSIDKLLVKEGELEGSAKLIVAEAAARGIPVVHTERAGLDRICGGLNHQGVIAYAAAKEYVSIDDILATAAERGEPPFVLVLDGIEDPYNLGAIIRTAECAGVHGVIIPKRRSATLSAAVEKTSAGALEYMAIARVPNLTAAVEELKEKGLWVYAAEAGGQPLHSTSMTGPIAVVMGGEGTGVSQLLRSKCDFTVSVPLCGRINSLNVSAAAAVVLYEVRNQRDDA